MSDYAARIVVLTLAFLASFCLIKGRYHEKNTVTRVGLVMLIVAAGFGFVWDYVLQHEPPTWPVVVITIVCGGLTGYLFGFKRINGRFTHPKRKPRR